MMIQHTLKCLTNEAEIETALDGCEIPMSEELVLQVLRRHRSDWKLALAFFNWSSARQQSLFVEKQHEFPPVIKTRNIILHGWCVVGSAREAKRFWNDIVVSGCKPDLITYGTIINSMGRETRDGGSEPDVTICNCIIDALCFKKRVPEALEVFAEMDGKGCAPNTVTYNCLIKHLCRIRRLEKAYGLLEEMEAKGCEADARTFGYFIKCARSTEEVGEVLERMRRSGCGMTGDAYNMVLKMHVGWGDFGAAERVWEEMEREGLGPDQRSYTIMVHRLCERRRMGEALWYFKETEEKGMVPEKRTYLVVKAINLKVQNSEARSSLSEGEVELNENSEWKEAETGSQEDVMHVVFG
ncbi:hypothetical protein QJS10_CPA03g00842 [Acorus calamus]|uniref:Pentatricopeptide repeat-containing protein n=1 Tax=Acorus calamus TaxID=4465 RepID=A0AAV9F3K8_ACOCL|nr:hypothetical protein QJS10_CPA03g00842 [Acorus calamus]